MSDIAIRPVEDVGMITLRGDPATLTPATQAVLQLDVPPRRRRVTSGTSALLWMSPDELMLTCDGARAGELSASLSGALDGAFATVADVSDARQVLELTGSSVEDLLARVMPVDFARLAPHEVRRTRLAQVPAAIWREGDGWRLACFRSVSVYVLTVLETLRGP